MTWVDCRNAFICSCQEKRISYKLSSLGKERSASLCRFDSAETMQVEENPVCLAVLLDAGEEVEFAGGGEEAGFDGVGGEFAELV
jgi:hypothetical protein